jgi:signal transduction histidine kinase
VSARTDPRRWWLDRIRPARVDALVTAALVVDLVLESALGVGIPHRLLTAVFGVAVAAPIAVRHRWPAAALGWAAAVCLLQDPFRGQLFNLPSGSMALVLMLYSYGAGAWLGPRRSVLAFAAAAALLVADQLIETYVTDVTGGNLLNLVQLMLIITAPWAVGRFINERNRRAEAFSSLAAHAATERTERERAAIAQERLTIGRELQDIIAHSVSVMVVQAGGARRSLHHDPDRARESMLNVEHTGREALAEMRRLLGLLRKDDDPTALTPQPGLDQLPELAAALQLDGLVCDLRTDGRPIDLTPGVDLVSYRVIETTLEQASASRCRHASATVRYQPSRLEIEVRGDRELRYRDEGLTSISERVALYGGSFEVREAGPAEFAVRCRLPLERSLRS